MTLDYRAEILDRLDSLLVGTDMSVDELDLGKEVARGQGGVVRRGTIRVRQLRRHLRHFTTFHDLSRIPQPFSTPHAPCAVIYVVTW